MNLKDFGDEILDVIRRSSKEELIQALIQAGIDVNNRKPLPDSFFIDPESEECQKAYAMAKAVGMSKEKAIELGLINVSKHENGV